MNATATAPEVKSYVAGEWRDGGRTVADVNPARPTERVAHVAMGDARLATQAIEAARAAIPAWKIAPALAYGNTVVWKPAGIVPLTATHLLQAPVDAGLPKGVLNLVIGSGSEVGDTLATHDEIDAITFTGSNAVGRALQEKAIARGKKVQLEMGGKNPSVVLADANLALAAEHVARGAFLSAGQKCTATSRVIVEQPVLKEFQERLVDLAKSWK